MENDDLWFSFDKYEHIIACFIITIFVSLVCRRCRFPLIRRRCAVIGSIAALLAGATKEIADEFGFYWQSSGGSVKDAVADFVGIVVANLFLVRFGFWRRQVDLNRRPLDLDSMV